jgi:hypothetical protein
MNDSSSRRQRKVDHKKITPNILKNVSRIENIFCPLGIGNHPDHVTVREVALRIWLAESRKPQLHFYEDLPYAARSKDLDEEVEGCIKVMSGRCGRLSIRYWPLSKQLLKRKLFFSKLYLTQNDHRKLLEQHARELGSMSRSAYAERYVQAV